MLWLGVSLIDVMRVVHVMLSRVVLRVRQGLGRGESVTEVCPFFCLLVWFTLWVLWQCPCHTAIDVGVKNWSMSYEVQSHSSLSSGASCQVRSCLFQLVCNVTFGFINDLDLISMICWLCSVPLRWHSNYRYCKSLELLAAKTLIPFSIIKTLNFWIEKPEKWWWGKMQKDSSWRSLSLAMTSLFMTGLKGRTKFSLVPFKSLVVFSPVGDTKMPFFWGHVTQVHASDKPLL